ncbi:MAG: alternative ribosome rescue factor ArfA [Alphaproteobacteria bacterium]|nr:alternative ribosome rescue factor ArfA [Alphaproteobacteria bacterium]MEE1554840.1 alternative ribosome rescue factor ArfA [Alphaproteobacteria bacterium]HJM90884.1 alternative ribosome rescue factor ArfA [Alphaproteobacteria bacterium]
MKKKRNTNLATKALRTPTFRQRKVRPKKGRGSYSRAFNLPETVCQLKLDTESE